MKKNTIKYKSIGVEMPIILAIIEIKIWSKIMKGSKETWIVALLIAGALMTTKKGKVYG